MRYRARDQLVHQWHRLAAVGPADRRRRRRARLWVPRRRRTRADDRASRRGTSRIVAWMTSTSSTGMPALICIRPAPGAHRPEQERGRAGSRAGSDRPSRATAIESKPTVVPKLDGHLVGDPEDVAGPGEARQHAGHDHRQDDQPARPHPGVARRRPGWRPTVRISKPRVVRYRSHQMTKTAATAMRMPDVAVSADDDRQGRRCRRRR